MRMLKNKTTFVKKQHSIRRRAILRGRGRPASCERRRRRSPFSRTCCACPPSSCASRSPPRRCVRAARPSRRWRRSPRRGGCSASIVCGAEARTRGRTGTASPRVARRPSVSTRSTTRTPRCRSRSELYECELQHGGICGRG